MKETEKVLKVKDRTQHRGTEDTEKPSESGMVGSFVRVVVLRELRYCFLRKLRSIWSRVSSVMIGRPCGQV
jgi:hypothetical protein